MQLRVLIVSNSAAARAGSFCPESSERRATESGASGSDPEGDEVEALLRSRAHTVLRLALPDEPGRTLTEIRAGKPDVVLPLVRPTRGAPRAAERLATLLDWAGIPYAGAAPMAHALALEKPIARSLLRSRGVPMPRGFVMADESVPVPDLGIGKRWIVKPAHEDGGRGIDASAVVSNERALRERVAWLVTTLEQPALVEEFVDGREFEVAILEGGSARALAPFEIDFAAVPRDLPRIAKRGLEPGSTSPCAVATPSNPAERLHPALEKALRHEALAASSEIGLAGWAIVDLRVCPERGPLVLDVNPGPELSSKGSYVRAGVRDGIEYAELVELLFGGRVTRGASTLRPVPLGT